MTSTPFEDVAIPIGRVQFGGAPRNRQRRNVVLVLIEFIAQIDGRPIRIVGLSRAQHTPHTQHTVSAASCKEYVGIGRWRVEVQTTYRIHERWMRQYL